MVTCSCHDLRRALAALDCGLTDEVWLAHPDRSCYKAAREAAAHPLGEGQDCAACDAREFALDLDGRRLSLYRLSDGAVHHVNRVSDAGCERHEGPITADDLCWLAGAEVQALRDALTRWCNFGDGPGFHPASASVTWSDRTAYFCAEHLPDAVVNIALDHSYDRNDMTCLRASYIQQVAALGLPAPPPDDPEPRFERAVVAARTYLAGGDPGGGRATANLSPEQRAVLMRLCHRAALGESR